MRWKPRERSFVFLTEKPPLSDASISAPADWSSSSPKAADTSWESMAGPNSAFM